MLLLRKLGYEWSFESIYAILSQTRFYRNLCFFCVNVMSVKNCGRIIFSTNMICLSKGQFQAIWQCKWCRWLNSLGPMCLWQCFSFSFFSLFYDNQRMVLGLDWRARVVESLLITSAGTEVTLFGKQTLNISSQNISSQDREYWAQTRG